MITTIFFDFDGVLTTDKTGSQTTCKNLSKLIPDVPFELITSFYRKRREELVLGEIIHADMWEEFCAGIGKKVDIKILDQAFHDTPKNIGMFELAKSLKSHYKLGIITDNNKERFELLTKEMKLRDIFDHIIVSADVGVMKDDVLIFQKALELAQSEASECIFIDNSEENLITPAQMGFKTIFHDRDKNDVPALIKQLKECGVTVELTTSLI